MCFTELFGKSSSANPGLSNDCLWQSQNHESLHSTWLSLYGNGVARLAVDWRGRGSILERRLGNSWWVSHWAQNASDPSSFGNAESKFQGFYSRSMPIHFSDPWRARHSASFQEYNADQDRHGPFSDGPQKEAHKTASIPYQMII